jgi:anti-sigma B factor antagonist
LHRGKHLSHGLDSDITTATHTESFTVRSERHGGSHTVRLSGGLDLAGRAPLMEELERLELSDATTLIVDLCGLEFIDSSGLDALVEAKRRWHEGGGRLEFLCAPGPIQILLQITGVDTLLFRA